MREIKFRAWDNMCRPAKMINWDELKFQLEAAFKEPVKNEIELMQYTGLKDNTKWEDLTKREQNEWFDNGKTKEEWNGKEIYSGDLVEFDYLENKEKMEVKFEVGMFGILIEGGFYPLSEYLHQNLKIIGNVWENAQN